MTRCQWCDRQFTARPKGGSEQRFCSTSCRADYHTACRKYGDGLVLGGAITVAALKEAAHLSLLFADNKRARSSEGDPTT